MPDSHLVEEKVASQELVKGSFIHAFRDTVKLPDGKLATREYVAHPGAVMIIPLLEDPNGAIRLVLERQFRYPLGQVMMRYPDQPDPKKMIKDLARTVHQQQDFNQHDEKNFNYKILLIKLYSIHDNYTLKLFIYYSL